MPAFLGNPSQLRVWGVMNHRACERLRNARRHDHANHYGPRGAHPGDVFRLVIRRGVALVLDRRVDRLRPGEKPLMTSDDWKRLDILARSRNGERTAA